MSTHNERLADHYLSASRIAAVYAEDGKDGARIGYLPNVRIAIIPGRVIFCCSRDLLAAHVAALAEARIGANVTLYDAAELVRAVAAEEGIGLMPHEKVIERAFAAVQTVNAKMEAMGLGGGIRALNKQFKTLRARGEATTYAGFLLAKKIGMLSILAGVAGVRRK